MRTRYIYIICATVLCVTVSSCRIGKDYVRPQTKMPLTFSLQTDTASIADMAWWKIYGDTTLQSLIRRALNHNQDVRIAAARVKEMEARKRISAADLLPRINADISANREVENYGGHNKDISETYEAKAVFAWELDLWGKLRWARDADVAAYLQSVEAQRALAMTIVSNVASAYFELLALDMELAIVKQTQFARKESVHLAKLRFEGGLTSETAYRQAQVELAKTAAMVPMLEYSITEKASQLALLVGDYPSHITRTSFLEDQKMPQSLPVGIPSYLLERRPDIRMAEQQLKEAHAKMGIAHTARFPALSITGGIGLESLSLKELLQSPYTLVEGGILSPLLSFGKNKAKYKAQVQVVEQASLHYEKVVLNAFHEVYQSLQENMKAKEVTRLNKKLELSSKSYMELAQLQYINGVISYMDVLDAQRAYFSAQISLTNAMRDEYLSVVKLYKAVGGGWSCLDCGSGRDAK